MSERNFQIVCPHLQWIVCALAATALNVLAQGRPEPAENVLRNAGFELDRVWNGGAMRQGGEFEQAQRQYHRKELAELPVEAWWAEGREATGVELTPNAHSGERAVRVTGPASIVSALDPHVPAGPVTLSAWVQATGATGALELLLPDAEKWGATDVLTDKSVTATVTNRLWAWHIELAPWEYRVIRLHEQ